MSKSNITTFEAANCLSFLQQAKGPIFAAELAQGLGLAGNRESQRRRVRAIVEHLRDDGHWIIATLQQGYYLTDDFTLWCDYLAGKQIDAKRILGRTHREKRIAVNAQGQGVLFQPAI